MSTKSVFREHSVSVPNMYYGYPQSVVADRWTRNQAGGNDKKNHTPQPYSTTVEAIEGGSIMAYGYPYPGPRPYDVNIPAMLVQNPPSSWVWTSNDEIELLSRLAMAVKGHSFNLGVQIGQAKESIQQITGIAESLAKGLRALKRRDFSTAARAFGMRPHKGQSPTKMVANHHLAIQYGILPMLNDAYDAGEALAVAMGKKPPKSSVRVRHRREFSQALDAYFVPWYLRCVCTGQIVATFTEDNPLSVPDHLGLTDPLPILWELTPYSFVADWFAPIGDWLEVRNIIPKLHGKFVVTHKRVVSVASAGDDSVNNYHFVAPASGYRMTMTRDVTSGLSVPLPQFKHPMEIPSWRRLFNAVALIRQKI